MKEIKKTPTHLHPDDIIAEFSKSGRTKLPPIDHIVADFKDPKIGQLQGVGVRPKEASEYKDDKREWVLVWGFSRYRAAVQVNNDRKSKPKAKPFLLKVEDARAGSDEASFEKTIIENAHRKNVDPIEQARAMKRCIDEFEWSKVKVAKRFGVAPAQVTFSMQLLNLPRKIRDRVADSEDPMQPKGARELTHAPSAVVRQAEQGKLSSYREIRAAIDKAGGKDESKLKRKPTNVKQRGTYKTVKQVRQVAELMKNDAHPGTQAIGAAIEKWLMSNLTDKALVRFVSKETLGESAPKPSPKPSKSGARKRKVAKPSSGAVQSQTKG